MQVIRFKKLVLSMLILILLLTFLCTSIYLQVDFPKRNLNTTSPELLKFHKSSKDSNSNLDNEFFVNTIGCKMIKLPVMTTKIKDFFDPPDPIGCSPPAITESDECKK